MANKSAFLKDAIINFVVRAQADAFETGGTTLVPTEVYVSLWLGDPQGAGSEVPLLVGGLPSAYARQRIDNIMSAPAGNGTSSNSSVIDFGIAATNWGTVTHFALHIKNESGALNDRLLYSNSLTVAQVISQGNQPKFLNGALSVTEL